MFLVNQFCFFLLICIDILKLLDVINVVMFLFLFPVAHYNSPNKPNNKKTTIAK